MSRYTLAASLSIAAGLLSIPLLFIAAGVGALEGLTDSRGPGLLLNGFALLSYLLHLFLYIVLGHYLRPARIRSPIRALIVLSCLGIVLLVVESLMQSLEYLFAILHLTQGAGMKGSPCAAIRKAGRYTPSMMRILP